MRRSLRRSLRWCKNGCGKKVMYHRDIGYVCESCKAVFTKEEVENE